MSRLTSQKLLAKNNQMLEVHRKKNKPKKHLMDHQKKHSFIVPLLYTSDTISPSPLEAIGHLGRALRVRAVGGPH